MFRLLFLCFLAKLLSFSFSEKNIFNIDKNYIYEQTRKHFITTWYIYMHNFWKFLIHSSCGNYNLSKLRQLVETTPIQWISSMDRRDWWSHALHRCVSTQYTSRIWTVSVKQEEEAKNNNSKRVLNKLGERNVPNKA